MAAKNKPVKKTVNFEKCFNKLANDMDSVCFTLFELRDEVFNGSITNKQLLEDLWNITNTMSNSLSDADHAADPLYKDND